MSESDILNHDFSTADVLAFAGLSISTIDLAWSVLEAWGGLGFHPAQKYRG
jgi:hypothetical protein